MGAQRKVVIRNGKRKIIYKCPAGFVKKKAGGRSCSKRSGAKTMKVRRQALKTARKAKRKRARTMVKRRKSNRKRRNIR